MCAGGLSAVPAVAAAVAVPAAVAPAAERRGGGGGGAELFLPRYRTPGRNAKQDDKNGKGSSGLGTPPVRFQKGPMVQGDQHYQGTQNLRFDHSKLWLGYTQCPVNLLVGTCAREHPRKVQARPLGVPRPRCACAFLPLCVHRPAPRRVGGGKWRRRGEWGGGCEGTKQSGGGHLGAEHNRTEHSRAEQPPRYNAADPPDHIFGPSTLSASTNSCTRPWPCLLLACLSASFFCLFSFFFSFLSRRLGAQRQYPQ